MDIGTLIGFVFGSGIVLYSILLGGSLTAFIDIPSVYCTCGGSFAAIIMSYPLPKVKAGLTSIKKLLNAGSLDMTPWYQTLIDLATVARRDGILALEDRLEGIKDEFLRRGLQMLVDGSPAETVTQILEMEIENMEARHVSAQAIWKSWSTAAPSFGMIGTLIGLVQMLKNMSDPSQIGAGMAVALITTFYGAVMANLFFTPMQIRLEQRTAEEVQLKKMLLAGILSIQSGDSPRVVGDKLQVYLTPQARLSLVPAEKKG